MTTARNSEGWWDVKPHDTWVCPECHEETPANDWQEATVGCEDCGDHDARECPACGERFEHVWGSEAIEDAIRNSTTRA